MKQQGNFMQYTNNVKSSKKNPKNYGTKCTGNITKGKEGLDIS